MTKAELKKLETEQKHEFIARVYATVLPCIPEQTIMLRKHLQIRLTHQGYNRYVRFHSYGMDMNIQIFGDGNVGIELNEALHNEHTEQLFEYASEKEVLMWGASFCVSGCRSACNWIIAFRLQLGQQ